MATSDRLSNCNLRAGEVFRSPQCRIIKIVEVTDTHVTYSFADGQNTMRIQDFRSSFYNYRLNLPGKTYRSAI